MRISRPLRATLLPPSLCRPRLELLLPSLKLGVRCGWRFNRFRWS